MTEQFDPQEEYDEPSFEPWSVGDHPVFITQAVLTSSRAGDPMLKLRVHGVMPGDDADKRPMYEYFLLTRQWFWKLRQLCRAVDPEMPGYSADRPDGFNVQSQESIHEWLLGRVVVMNVRRHKKETYEGETRLREVIGGWRAVRSDEADALQQRYDRGNGECSPALPDDAMETTYDSGGGGGKSNAGGFSDDDIPF